MPLLALNFAIEHFAISLLAPLGDLLTLFAADDFADVLDALALVRFSRVERTDARGGLANELLADQYITSLPFFQVPYTPISS